MWYLQRIGQLLQAKLGNQKGHQQKDTNKKDTNKRTPIKKDTNSWYVYRIGHQSYVRM